MSDIAALVAGNLDIWTSATQRKSGAGRGGSSKRISLYGIERLRMLILDLAVRGNLVAQDAGDEPASTLLTRLARDKAAIIPSRKARKSMASGDDGVAFIETSLPKSWQAVALCEIATIHRGVTYGKSDASDTELPGLIALLRGHNIQSEINLENLVYVPKSKVASDQSLKAGDIVIAMSSGSADLVGKAAQFSDEHEVSFGAFCGVIRPVSEVIQTYLAFFCRTPFYRNQTQKGGKGIGIQNLSKGDLERLICPIPPLAEQRRIVAKVDELMALCDTLERESADAMAAHQALVEELLATLVISADAADLAANWARLETHFDTLFTTDASIEALKQTILDLAVRGKLVEQDAGDEEANVLLKQLKSDRSWVVGKGRGGKPKAIAPILDGSEPYELPIGWLWARVADVFQVTSGGTIEASLEKDEGAFPYLKVADMNLLENDVFIKTSSRFIDPDEKQMRALIRPNSIIFPKRGGAIATNKKRIVTSGIFVDLNIMAITVSEKFSLKYVYFWLQGIDLALLNTGTSVPQINHQDIDPLAFPIPPLAEQHRIVAKVDALMALCDQLKTRLADAARTQRHLADAITERAAA